MEQNKNNRLDELFNQAKNEPSKVSYEETKEQFINSNASFSNKAAKGGKLTQFSNLKTLIMISTISTITIGVSILAYNYSEPNNYDQSVLNEKGLLSDSISIIEEHEKVVNEYLQEVALLKMEGPEVFEVSSELGTTLKSVDIEQPNPIIDQEYDGIEKIKTIEEDSAYRFPKLTYEDVKANHKRKKKVIKLLSKRVAYGYLRIPSGELTVDGKTVNVESFDMKQTEVTNLQYKTFLFDLLIQGRKEEFLIAKPDQEMWTKEYEYSFNEPMVEHYFSHAAYNEYPVVAISREGAEMYCKWLSKEINKTNQKKLDGEICQVRIPTINEWMYAAYGGHSEYIYPWCGNNNTNAKGKYLANFQPIKGNFKIDGAFHTAEVSAYNPNEFDLYNMSGNVAEMVYYGDENNMPGTKGGSWTSLEDEIKINGKDRFKGVTTPSVNIGLRPVISFVMPDGNGSGEFGYKSDVTITPPGTVKVNPNFYADKTEVTNFNWREYVIWNESKYGKNSLEHKNALPDTTVWNDLNSVFMGHYYFHPAYYNYPVVGITYEQAVAFCKWRTDRVKELYEIRKKTDKKNVYPINFEYRLPTKKEWERIANAGYSEKTLKKLEGKHEGKPRNNFKTVKRENIGIPDKLTGNPDITAPVQSYWPNKYGVYNMIGNVAEMISEKGTAKGGSWVHYSKDSTVEKDLTYNEPESWLGFRCVLEIQE